MTVRPPALLAFLLSLIGLGLSGYLTYEHYTGSTTLACSDNGAVNCLKVTTSDYATILGVPVALLGLLFFVFMVLMTLPIAATAGFHQLRLAACGIGILMILWLIFVEAFKVNAICLWCTGVHVTTLLLTAVVVWWWRSDVRADLDERDPAAIAG